MNITSLAVRPVMHKAFAHRKATRRAYEVVATLDTDEEVLAARFNARRRADRFADTALTTMTPFRSAPRYAGQPEISWAEPSDPLQMSVAIDEPIWS